VGTGGHADNAPRVSLLPLDPAVTQHMSARSARHDGLRLQLLQRDTDRRNLRLPLGAPILVKVHRYLSGMEKGIITCQLYHESQADQSDRGLDRCAPYQVQVTRDFTSEELRQLGLTEAPRLVSVPHDDVKLIKSERCPPLPVHTTEIIAASGALLHPLHTTPVLLSALYDTAWTHHVELDLMKDGTEAREVLWNFQRAVDCFLAPRNQAMDRSRTAIAFGADFVSEYIVSIAKVIMQLSLWGYGDILDTLLRGAWPMPATIPV
jgi:hypothetical protein